MNFRLLLSIILIATLVACGGAEERKAVYLEKARVSLDAGDLDKARIELKNVLQIDPKDSEAYYQLGKVYEQQKSYQKAFANYKKAEGLNPDLLENQAKLGRIYLLFTNDLEKVHEKIDFILTKDPDNAEGLLLKSLMLLKNKNKTEAIKIAKNVVAKQPGHVDGAIYLAMLYAREDNAVGAIEVLENSLKINLDNEVLNKNLAAILVKNKEFDRAEVIYKSFLERNPGSAVSYNNLASFYNQSDNKAKAEEMLRASIDSDPGNIDRQLTLVKYIKVTKGNDDAIIELKKLIDKNAGLGKLRVALAELLYKSGDKQSAMDIYNKAIKDFSEEVTGVESRISLAIIYLGEKNFVKAGEIIDDAIKVSPNDPKVNFLKAKLALRDKDFEQAIISLRIVTKETPENIEAFFLLANVYKLEGNEAQSNSTLNSAYDNNITNADGLLKLAQYHLSRDINQAEKIIDNYNRIKESDYEGLSIKAAILNQNKAQSEAFEIATMLMKTYPKKPNGYLQVIPYYSQQNDKKKAISVLEEGYINAKNNRKILILLSSIQLADKQFDVVLKRIKAELMSLPDDVELKLLLSKVYMGNGDNDSAIPLLNEVIDSKPEQEEPYLLLSNIHQSKKDFGVSKTLLIKGVSNVESSIKISLKLSSVYELEGDYKKAIDVLRAINKIKPNSLLIINNLASMLSDHGDNDNDLVFAHKLIEPLKEVDQPVFSDTIGWVYFKRGDYQSAIQYLTQVVEKMPEINVFNYHLGMAYKMSGDNTQAKTYLEKSLANDKKFRERDLAKAALKEL